LTLNDKKPQTLQLYSVKNWQVTEKGFLLNKIYFLPPKKSKCENVIPVGFTIFQTCHWSICYDVKRKGKENTKVINVIKKIES
jgi:hypothetical protein